MALFRSRRDEHYSNTGRTAGAAGRTAIIHRAGARSTLRSFEPTVVRCPLLLCVVLHQASSGTAALVCLDVVTDRALDVEPLH